MDLRDAVVSAAAYAAKADPVWRNLRFIAAHDGVRASVYATDGATGAQFFLDDDIEVVEATLPAEALLAMARTARRFVGMKWAGVAGERVSIEVENGQGQTSTGRVAAIPGRYPLWHLAPGAFHPLLGWQDIAGLLHVVKAADDPLFSCLHFGKDKVEATDGDYRLAYVDVETGLRGLVPQGLFRGLTAKTPVEVASTDSMVFLRSDADGLYFGKYARAPKPYPNIAAKIPEQYDGAWSLLDTKAILEACKQATKMSAQRLVHMHFKGDGCVVEASSAAGDAGDYATTVPVIDHGGPAKSVLVNGKFVVDAIGTCQTPRVLLGYGTETDPLRVETGRYVEAIWPMIPD